MKITEQEKEVRKERIMQAAFALFCEKGIEKVSMEDIARSAKVGNTTIYRYFVNKPLLVADTLSVLWKSIGEKLKEKEESTEGYDRKSGKEQIRVQLETLRQTYLENKNYVFFSYEAKLYLIRNSVHISKKRYDYLMYEIKETCVAAIEKGKGDGSIPCDRESDELFYAIWGSVRGYIVKILIYSSLCEAIEDEWNRSYGTMVDGILSALHSGWDSGL